MDEVYRVGRPDGFRFELHFTNRVHERYRPAIRSAADRWATLVTGPKLPGPPLVIVVTARSRDRKYLAVTNAWATWPADAAVLARRPSLVEISFTRDHLTSLSHERLRQLALHEMAHGFGMALAWSDLLKKRPNGKSVFVGTRAMAEYGALLGTGVPTPVPLDGGGLSTHWSGEFFSGEMMNAKLEEKILPLSVVTLTSLVDLGYEVKVDAADAFALEKKQ